MRRILRGAAAGLLAATLLTPAAGCSLFSVQTAGAPSKEPTERRVFQTLDAMEASVDAAMKVAGQLYQDGVMDDQDKATVLDLYAKYQKAATSATLALRVGTSGQDLSASIADVSRAASLVKDLIASFSARKARVTR